MPCSTLCAPSSPDGTTCEWMSTKPGTATHGTRAKPRLLGLEVELEARRHRPQLPQRAGLELTDPLARDAELAADLLERLRFLAVEPEPQRQDALHARVEAGQRSCELAGAEVLRRRARGRLGVLVLDQVGVEALAVADGRLEADRVLDQLQELVDALYREPALGRELLGRRVAVELLCEDPACPEDAARLLCHMHRQPDRAALVGERARDRLADPPGGVGRELVAELPVELLHGADQAEVALLDEVQERDAGLRVVARDRHHQAQVRLDQPLLGELVARVLAPGELALL